MKNHVMTVAGLLAVLILLGGCATTGTVFPTLYASARTSAGETEKTLTEAEARAAMIGYLPYATMSEAVYRRQLRNATPGPESACDYVTAPAAGVMRLDLPKDWIRLDKKLMVDLGMEAANPAEPLRPCRGARGLEYETYVLLDRHDRPLAATIAFRGTENSKGQWLSDWVANFSNVDFGVGGNAQFNEAREEGSRMIAALSRVLPKTTSSTVCAAKAGATEGVQAPIDLTGHSLGGGLAQHLAYASDACQVRSTITFDPSPATGWFYLHLRKGVVTRDPIIERVYIDGEALSFVRKVSTKFNTPRDNRRDMRFVFPGIDVGAFGRHSMTLFAGAISTGSTERPALTPAAIDDYASGKIYPEVTDIKEN